MRCPHCNSEISYMPIKKWLYGGYEVGRYECQECGGRFNSYEQDGEMIFTVPKSTQNSDLS